MYLQDLKELRLRRPPCSFQVLLKLRVIHHLLKGFSRLPHVDYHYAIIGSRTGVRYALRLLAGNGMLKLSIVGAKELVRVSFPPEQNEYGGSLQSYWTVGPYDLVVILEAPDDESATAFFLERGAAGAVRTTTLRAYDREEMSSILERLG